MADETPTTKKPHQRFPGIALAALEISYDNGGINRDRSEADMFRDLDRCLDTAGMDPGHLHEIDAWLGSLVDDDLGTVCSGEETEMLALLKGGPPFTQQLLNDIFKRAA
jgi:hypothetical protein